MLGSVTAHRLGLFHKEELTTNSVHSAANGRRRYSSNEFSIFDKVHLSNTSLYVLPFFSPLLLIGLAPNAFSAIFSSLEGIPLEVAVGAIASQVLYYLESGINRAVTYINTQLVRYYN